MVAFTYFENHVYLVTRHLDKFGVKRCKIYGPPPRNCEVVKMSLNFIHFLTIMQENRQRTPSNYIVFALVRNYSTICKYDFSVLYAVLNPCHEVLCSGICVTSPAGLMCQHFDGSVSPIVDSKALVNLSYFRI